MALNKPLGDNARKAQCEKKGLEGIMLDCGCYGTHARPHHDLRKLNLPALPSHGG